MTIVNVTPDSFYAASRVQEVDDIIARVRQAAEEGCSIVDIGGCSSRPMADDIPVGEEMRRVELGIRCVREVSRTIPISIDTFRSKVAERALMLDDRIIINDISAGDLDPAMVRVAAEADVPYIAMHMRGTPATMSGLTEYEDVAATVADELARKVERLTKEGMREGNIILDAGFGFAKTLEQNYELLGRLKEVCAAGFAVVAGLSRKSMIYKVLGTTPEGSLTGTSVLNWEALRQGASILRVHDTRAAVETVRIFNEFQKQVQ